MAFTATETAEIGCELGTTVEPDTSPAETRFTGTINGSNSAPAKTTSHMIDPEDVVHMRIGKQ
jgi:hypothetical protein